MRQTTDPDRCRACTAHTVCTAHAHLATAARPAAADLLAVVARDDTDEARRQISVSAEIGRWLRGRRRFTGRGHSAS